MCRYTDVKRKEDRSTFIRPHEGLFGLREWVEEGVDFKVRILYCAWHIQGQRVNLAEATARTKWEWQMTPVAFSSCGEDALTHVSLSAPNLRESSYLKAGVIK